MKAEPIIFCSFVGLVWSAFPVEGRPACGRPSLAITLEDDVRGRADTRPCDLVCLQFWTGDRITTAMPCTSVGSIGVNRGRRESLIWATVRRSHSGGVFERSITVN